MFMINAYLYYFIYQRILPVSSTVEVLMSSSKVLQ